MQTTTTLESFMAGAVRKNPRHLKRGIDGADWFAADGTPLFHERRYIPYSFLKPITESYWTEPVYSNHAMAEQEAAQWGGHVEEVFYCDPENPLWFLIFDDLDKALAFMHHKIQNPVTI